MKMFDVKSSNIEAIGFHNGVMNITFSDGKTYRYENITEDLFNNFKKAESLGDYFARHIRPHYKGVKV